MSESHPQGLGPLPPVGAGPDPESEEVNKEGFAGDELLYEVDAVLDPIMALEMFCRSVVPAHRLAYAASISAAAAEAPPHVVDGTLVPLLKELYTDSYADVRGVALGQTTATAKVLAGAGPLYRPRLEALWSCLEGMLLDGDLENQELAAAALADLAHLLAPAEIQAAAQRVCSAVDRLTNVKPALADEGLIQAMRLVTQVMRPRPGSPLSYASMSHFIAPLFLDLVLKGSEVVREAATAFLPELLLPLTPTQRQELLPPLVTALVKDKYWNVRAAAAVMLANLLEEVKDLNDEERLSIRKHLCHLCDDASPRVEVAAYMVLGIVLPLLPPEEGLSKRPPLLKHFAFAADVPPVLQVAAIDPILVPGAVHASASAAAVEMELAAGVGATTAAHDMSGKVVFAGRTRSTTAAAAAAVAGLAPGGGAGGSSTGAVWLPRCVAHYLPQVVTHLGAASWRKLGTAWRDLVRSKDVAVLRSLLAGTPALAAALGPELTHRDLLPPVIDLIDEQLDVVAPVVSQHVCALLAVLPRAQQLRLLQLLPALVVQTGGGDAGDWRSRVHIAQQLAGMAALLPPHQVGYRVWPLLLTLCKDPVHAVRVAAATQAGGVLQHIPAAAGSLGIHLDTPASPDVTSDPGGAAAGDLGDHYDAPKAAAAGAACGGVPNAAGKQRPRGTSPTDDAAGDTGVPSDQSSRAGDTAAAANSSKTGSNAMAAAIASDAAGSVPAASQQPGAAAAVGSGAAGGATLAAAQPQQQAEAAAVDSSGRDTAAAAAAAASEGGVREGAPPSSTAAGKSLSRTSSSSSGSSSDAGDGADLDRGHSRGGWLRSSFTSFLSTGWDLGSHLLEQAASHYQHLAHDAARLGHHHTEQHTERPASRLVPLGREDPGLGTRLPLPTIQLLLGDLASMLHSSHAAAHNQEASDTTGSSSSSSSKGWQQRQVCALALGSVLAVAITGGQAAAVAATVAADKAAADDSGAPASPPVAAAMDAVSERIGRLGIHAHNSSHNSAAAQPAGEQQPGGNVEVAGYGIAAAPVALLDLLHLLLDLRSDAVPGVRVTLARVLLHLRELLTTAAVAAAAGGSAISSDTALSPAAEGKDSRSTAAAAPAPAAQGAGGTPGGGSGADTAASLQGDSTTHTPAIGPVAPHTKAAAALLQGEAAAAVLEGVEECLQQLQADTCPTVAELAGRPRPPLKDHGLVLTETQLY